MEKDIELMYQDKIKRLEEDITGLRMSRRIMMTLLEQSQISSKSEQDRLQKENRRLSRQVSSYAKRLMAMHSEASSKEKL